jgi:putative DNA primase/helicase
MTTPLAVALRYAKNWAVSPCRPDDKSPYPDHGFYEASRDPAQIARWWTAWPNALIDLPTGEPSGVCVLDIDTKRPGQNGYDTLENDYGYSVFPETPMIHTRSGGLHIHFQHHPKVRNTAGTKGRGIGAGLDWRGFGGYVILPSPGSGYSWDAHLHYGTCHPVAVPEILLPRERPRRPRATPLPTSILTRYAEVALDRAARAIADAPAGEQETTLNGEAYGIGKLAGRGQVPADFALRVLLYATSHIVSRNPRRPWTGRQLEAKTISAVSDGVRDG